MHKIQIHILRKLMLSKKAKYSELKLKGVEGNLFSYHLKILLKEGRIESKGGTYRLTPKSKLYVDKVSAETFNITLQPKIVTMLVIESRGKFILSKMKRLPFINHIGFPYGKVHLEETVDEAANRELFEKTGLQATLKHRGIVSITIHEETELVSQMLCHVFTNVKMSVKDEKSPLANECFWGKVSDFPKNNLVPGALKIEKLLKQNVNKFFFAEYFLNSSDAE